jgi:hypothetical protein
MELSSLWVKLEVRPELDAHSPSVTVPRVGWLPVLWLMVLLHETASWPGSVTLNAVLFIVKQRTRAHPSAVFMAAYTCVDVCATMADEKLVT